MSYVSATELLGVEQLEGRPVSLTAAAPGGAAPWFAEHGAALHEVVARHGAVHVRGLGVNDAETVGTIANSLMTRLITDKEAFAARELYPSGIYTSSAWPAQQQMCMHHELSYRLDPPAAMLFACLNAPDSGGSIGLADGAEVLASLPDALVARFRTEGWILTRAYSDEIGLSVADAFGTSDRSEIETYCGLNHIEYEWQDDGGLRTRQRRHAVVRHPVTGDEIWFNQIAFLSEWTLNPEVRSFLVDMNGADGLPFNTRFGNGDALDAEIVQIINDAYDLHTINAPLESGDVLLVDNVRTAHSRQPYEGNREVLVALGEGLQAA